MGKGDYLRFKNRRQTATNTTRGQHVRYQASQAVRRSNRNVKKPDRFGDFVEDPTEDVDDKQQSDEEGNEDRRKRQRRSSPAQSTLPAAVQHRAKPVTLPFYEWSITGSMLYDPNRTPHDRALPSRYPPFQAPRPDMDNLPLKPIPDTFVLPNNQPYVAAMMRLQEVKQKLKQADQGNNKWHDNARAWCRCRRGNWKGGTGFSIECEDPDCPYGWWHWECLTPQEREFATTWKMWMCSMCWQLRCVQFFKQHPDEWLNGVTNIEQLAEKRWALDDINHAVDVEIVTGEMDFPVAVCHAARRRLEARKGPQSFGASQNTNDLPTTNNKTHDDGSKTSTVPKNKANSAGHQIPRFYIPTGRWSDPPDDYYEKLKEERRPPNYEGSPISEESAHSIHHVPSPTPPLERDLDNALVDEVDAEADSRRRLTSYDPDAGETSTQFLHGDTSATAFDVRYPDEEEQDDTVLPSIELPDNYTTLQGPDVGDWLSRLSSRSVSRPTSQQPTFSSTTSTAIRSTTSLHKSTEDVLPAKKPPTSSTEKAPKPTNHISVYDREGLELSARLWTTPSSRVTVLPGAHPPLVSFSLQYKHAETVPRPTSSATVTLTCERTGRKEPSVVVNAELLAFFSRLAWRGGRGPAALAGASIKLPHVSRQVAQACVEYLKGNYIFIKMPAAPATEDAKKLLLQYAHFAHVLGIQPLMNAAMHALCAAVHRDPEDWLANDDGDDGNGGNSTGITRLLDQVTFPGNPARRYLETEARSLVVTTAERSGGLPCDADEVGRMCAIDADSLEELW